MTEPSDKSWAERNGVREKYRPAIERMETAFSKAVAAGTVLYGAAHTTVVATVLFAKAWFELWRASKELHGVTPEELYDRASADQEGPRS